MDVIPYIGICGVEQKKDVEAALSGLYEVSPDRRTRQVKIGVKSSFLVRQVTTEHEKLYSVLHFKPKKPAMFHEELVRLFEKVGEYLDGVQLECDSLPHPKMIDYVRSRSQWGFIAVRVAEAAEANINNLVSALRSLHGLVEVISLDYTNLGMIPLYKAQPLLDNLEVHFPHLAIALTGNLGPDDISLMENLFKRHPRLSLETIPGPKMTARMFHEAGFDTEKVRCFVRRAYETF